MWYPSKRIHIRESNKEMEQAGELMITVGDIIHDGKHIVTRVEPLCGGDLAWVSWKDVEQEDDECPTNQ